MVIRGKTLEQRVRQALRLDRNMKFLAIEGSIGLLVGNNTILLVVGTVANFVMVYAYPVWQRGASPSGRDDFNPQQDPKVTAFLDQLEPGSIQRAANTGETPEIGGYVPAWTEQV